MCGIAGFVHASAADAPPDDTRRAWLAAMTERLAHRGPDGSGQALVGPAALGHRRLSIIDLEGGAQPMSDPSGRLSVTFNGEIYNYREIKADLAARGYRFQSHSDTEVILAGWLFDGPACLERFEGMFAFALFDSRDNTLFAARDRFGKKPFYYTLTNGLLAFASELSALAALPFFRRRVSRQSLVRFLAHEYVPTPESIYLGVKKLPPAHHLLFRDGRLTVAPYWDMPPPEAAPPGSEEEVCERLRFLMAQAVKRRLVSDVPLGVFLSGGVDSSAVAALMASMSARIKTFSIGFTEASYDETRYSRLMARRHATEHTERILSAAECGSLLPDIVARLDEPMADPSIVPTYLLSRITREHVTVALGGDGPDELFAGYEYYSGFRLAERYLALPPFLRHRLIEPLTRMLPQSSGYVNPRHVARTFLAGVAAPRWLRVQTWLSAISPAAQADLFLGADPALFAPETVFAKTHALYDAFEATDPLAKVFYLFARQYMLDYILVKVDRCSMMHSLEVRAPFLDRDLAEYACRLPVDMKLHGLTRKYILKKALTGIVPKSILYRQKRGFLIPVAAWLRENLRPQVEEFLGEPWLRRQGLFNPARVRAMVEDHMTGRRDRRKELWTLLVLQLWLNDNKPEIV